MFKGSITALITPFKQGEVDWKAFDNLVEWQIQEGTHALVPCGTTGESPTLSHEEHNAIVKRCVEIAAKRVPVMAGTGSNSTKEAIALTSRAKEDGADAALVVTPYYNKPTQEGLYAHYKAIHDAAGLPIVIYNIPGRCVIDMNVDTMARLAKLPHIIGVKDATGDLARPLEVLRKVGPDFCQLSGDDITAAAFLAQGGVGCISVVSNVAPRLSSQLYEAWFKGDFSMVADIRDRLALLAKNLFCESNPGPVKYAAQVMGLCSDEVRLPLLPASAKARELVDEALSHAGLTQGAPSKVAHG
ncbi:MAG: 4-hydroxy-tetrahydrodipicolinate synthase [Alphaproteobacteria bacterium]|nr:4-hydroxy-tetrahydrodipicolinate synthase [Alphaproteobacteria bacterium]